MWVSTPFTAGSGTHFVPMAFFPQIKVLGVVDTSRRSGRHRRLLWCVGGRGCVCVFLFTRCFSMIIWASGINSFPTKVLRWL